MTETVEAPAKKILIAQRVGDSIAAAHGPNYYNKLVQEDIGNDLKKYINKFRGKHCPMIEELPFKFNDVAKEAGVTGSRIMGGGFGGCTINLVADELAANFKKVVVEKFEKKYGKKPIVIDVVIGDGSRKLC